MRNVSWSTALILLAVLLALPGVWAAGMPAPQIAHPAGCHQHGPIRPSPAAPSHQCCATGHQWAIPGTNSSPGRPAALSLRLESNVSLRGDVTYGPAVSLFVLKRDLPSDSSPLRI
jgi:hypothetical protein